MRSAFIVLVLLFGWPCQAHHAADSTSVHCGSGNLNMMLNAESATVPREINIGLPESGNGAVIMIDGMRHGQGPVRSQYHWCGGNSYLPSGSIGLIDAVITSGEICILVDSRTRTGGPSLSGAFTLGTSSNGLLRFDGYAGGPLGIKSGWYFSIGAYSNSDPSSVNAPSRRFVDNKQSFLVTVSRRWKERFWMDFIYRFSSCGDNVGSGYSSAPFIYNGDGGISSKDGFRPGRDCYFPADDSVEYMDISTGRMAAGHLGIMDVRHIHDFIFRCTASGFHGWNFCLTFHGIYMQPGTQARISLAGIDTLQPSGGYSLPSGEPFSGPVQHRLVTVDSQWTADLDLLLTAEKRFGSSHRLRTGLEFGFASPHDYGSTFTFAHSAEANPSRLLRNGELTWGLNTGGLYYDAFRYYLPMYAIYDWTPSDRLHLRAGLRARPVYQQVTTAARLEDEPLNVRVDGFNVADGSLCSLHHLNLPGVDYAASGQADVKVCGPLHAMAEGFYSKTVKSASYYRNATLPSTAPIGNAMGRAGLTMSGRWYDMACLLSYITSWNNAGVISVTKQIGGVSETIPWTSQYGIGTLGVTLDGTARYSGFAMHLLCTWQDPRYRNYNNDFVFSDGSVSSICYTGRHVTGISQVMLELDPSYTWKNVKLWASARYYSRQYASRTNLAYFSGHWETFAGVDWNVVDGLQLSVDFVNVLAQGGVKGSIDVADTIIDPSAIEGYLMAGTYIRPFTAELMLTYRF